MTIHGRVDQPLTGALLAFCSMSLFSIQDALIKLLASNFSLFQILFVRSLVIVVPLLCILVSRHGTRALHTNRPGDHALRVSFNFFAFLSYYYAITRLPLAQTTAIALSAPLIMTALSGPLLGEHPGYRRKAVLVIGFIGVTLVVRPEFGQTDWIGIGAALLGAFLFAMLAIQNRRMSSTESTELMVFYGALTFLVVTGIMMTQSWQSPASGDLVLLGGVGVVSLFAQLLIVHATRFAAVYVLAPFEYVTILWALMLGWVFFFEIPTAMMLVGSAIIIACGLVIVKLEHRTRPPAKIAH